MIFNKDEPDDLVNQENKKISIIIDNSVLNSTGNKEYQ